MAGDGAIVGSAPAFHRTLEHTVSFVLVVKCVSKEPAAYPGPMECVLSVWLSYWRYFIRIM